jgi:hypothetical protein
MARGATERAISDDAPVRTLSRRRVTVPRESPTEGSGDD